VARKLSACERSSSPGTVIRTWSTALPDGLGMREVVNAKMPRAALASGKIFKSHLFEPVNLTVACSPTVQFQ
jgi:hypothetical protein